MSAQYTKLSDTISENEHIRMEKWGSDHWKLLAYVENRVVDYKGKLDHLNMRCNADRHPLLFHRIINEYNLWKEDTYGTRLRDGSVVGFHDDWDCLDDLEYEGLIEIISLVNGLVKMKMKGYKIVSSLREYISSGNMYKDFTDFLYT